MRCAHKFAVCRSHCVNGPYGVCLVPILALVLMAGSWSLIGIMLFIGFILTGSPTLKRAKTRQLALFLPGIFPLLWSTFTMVDCTPCAELD
jgi:hypothetical protein